MLDVLVLSIFLGALCHAIIYITNFSICLGKYCLAAWMVSSLVDQK